MTGLDEMDISATTKDDIIEDCSEGECDVPSSQAPPASASLTSPGIAGRFESFLGARQSEGDLKLEADTQAADSIEIAKNLEPIAEDDLLPTQMNVDGNSSGNVDEEATLPGPDAEAETFLEEDALPGPDAEDETFLEEDVHLNEDGTITGGPAAGDDEESDFEEEAPFLPNILGDAKTVPTSRPQLSTRPAEVSDGSSDGEEAEEQALIEEDWKDRPSAERDLWERVRPRALRREAARVKELKLPAAVMNRLTRLHPDMQTKTSDALETINCATVLLLQAVAQATIRGRKAVGHRVKFEDVKQVCLNNRELHFLLPLSATLDASTLSMSRHDPDVDGAKVAGGTRVAAGPGQSTLSSSTFARNIVDDVHADDLDVVTVQGNLESSVKTPSEKKGSKRKLPPSAKKAASKAPRQAPTPDEKATAASGMASLFKSKA